MIQIALLILVVMAIFTIQTQKLRHAVIYMGVFSLSISFVYVLYNAPDVAIAEAVVGSTLATILYLVALQKYKVFTVYFHVSNGEVDDDHFSKEEHVKLVKSIEIFCAKQALEPQMIYTTETVEVIKAEHVYALIVEECTDHIIIFGHPENYKMDALVDYISQYKHLKDIEFVKVQEVIE